MVVVCGGYGFQASDGCNCHWVDRERGWQWSMVVRWLLVADDGGYMASRCLDDVLRSCGLMVVVAKRGNDDG